jgi:hypothetical protein
MYRRGVLFVPRTRCGGVRKASTVWRQVAMARGSESSAAKSVQGTRCGGVRKASTVWRQVATARGPESSAAKSVQGTRCGADTYVSHGPMARAITETSEVSP